MKEIVRLGIVLMLICAIAAGALAYTNQVTSKIIAQREYDEKVALMQDLFPTLATFEDKEVDGRTATVGFDASGNVVGILADAKTAGYGGDIRFNLALDGEGKIIKLTILSHSETAGLGAKITEDGYREQYVGKTAGDDFGAIDNISGATVSSKAMESGVEKELNEILLRFTGDGAAAAPSTPSFNLADVADGTYTGTGAGFKADITVEVTVAGGKITAVTVLENQETPDRMAKAEEEVIQQILDKQAVQVDVASGASSSSEGIMEAVLNALTQ